MCVYIEFFYALHASICSIRTIEKSEKCNSNTIMVGENKRLCMLMIEMYSMKKRPSIRQGISCSS